MAHDASLLPQPPARLADYLFGTTFSTHRVSPLFVQPDRAVAAAAAGSAPALAETRLRALAQRLRAALVGDVVRGVEVGLAVGGGNGVGEESLGALEAVEVRVLDAGLLVAGGGGGSGGRDGQQSLLLFMRYEHAVCSALLLPPVARGDDAIPEGGGARKGFWHLPLLLLRMPARLKPFVVDWIASTFDCRVSPLRLGTRTLVRCFESWLGDVGSPGRGALARDAVVTLGFFVPPGMRGVMGGDEGMEAEGKEEKEKEEHATAAGTLAIKSVDVIISAADLGRFAQGGSAGPNADRSTTKLAWETDVERRRILAGGKKEEGWLWREKGPDGAAARPQAAQPCFTEALARYLDQNLALNLFHPGVRITKIACAGFVISETRLKLFRPPTSDAEEVDVDPSNAMLAIRSILADLSSTATGQ